MITSGAIAAIFYSINGFQKEFVSHIETVHSLNIPKQQQAIIEIDFGDNKRRTFAGNLGNETYPLEEALESVAQSGKLIFEIKRGSIKRLIGVGDISGSWIIYQNGKRATVSINKLSIASGDKYTIKLEK